MVSLWFLIGLLYKPSFTCKTSISTQCNLQNAKPKWNFFNSTHILANWTLLKLRNECLKELEFTKILILDELGKKQEHNTTDFHLFIKTNPCTVFS